MNGKVNHTAFRAVPPSLLVATCNGMGTLVGSYLPFCLALIFVPRAPFSLCCKYLASTGGAGEPLGCGRLHSIRRWSKQQLVDNANKSLAGSIKQSSKVNLMSLFVDLWSSWRLGGWKQWRNLHLRGLDGMIDGSLKGECLAD